MEDTAAAYDYVPKREEQSAHSLGTDEFEDNPAQQEDMEDPDVDVDVGALQPVAPGRAQLSERRISVLARREPILAGLEDHFTLPTSSNLVRFRSKQNAARVFDEGAFQTVMEEHYDPASDSSTITVKRMENAGPGVSFLRISYSVVCALWTGFFFVFCMQVLLVLVLDLAVESGATSNNASVHVGTTIGVAVAILVFVHAFSEALVVAGHYIIDTWSGHYLAKQFMFKKLSVVAIDWVFFFFFLLCPLLVMCATLLMQREDWWDITAVTW
jgi:hypothetical protein